MVTGRTFGLVVAVLAWLITTYEIIGIVSPGVPTISRILQGWRDGPGSNLPVWVAVVLILTVLNLFSAWLFHHLLFEQRSIL